MCFGPSHKGNFPPSIHIEESGAEKLAVCVWRRLWLVSPTGVFLAGSQLFHSTCQHMEVFFSNESTLRGSGLGQWQPACRILECTGQTGQAVTPLRKGLLPPAVSFFRVCLSCSEPPFTSGAAALQCLTRERICCLWLDYEENSLAGSFWVLQSPRFNSLLKVTTVSLGTW